MSNGPVSVSAPMKSTDEERLRYYARLEESREREFQRVSAQGVSLDDELDDLLLQLSEDDAEAEPAAQETQQIAPTCAQVATNGEQKAQIAADPIEHPAADFLKDYGFPDTALIEPEYESLPDAELRRVLIALSNTSPAKGELMPYHLFRDQYCAISMVMNQRGIQPPIFRPKRSLPKPIKGQKPDLSDTLMMLDRQVIDLHWLHCRGKRDLLATHKYFAELFAEEEFNIDLAAEFACKSWSIASKTHKVLDLMDFDQWQMAYFRGKPIEDSWRNAELTMNSTIDKRLRQHTLKKQEFAAHVQGLKQLWLADKMASDLGQKMVGQVYGWLTGEEPLAKGTLSAKLKRMKRRTAPMSSRS